MNIRKAVPRNSRMKVRDSSEDNRNFTSLPSLETTES
jgi:hypothetical protein